MTLDEAKRELASKRQQLIDYRSGIVGDTPSMIHAASVAEARIQQIEMDIRLIDRVSHISIPIS